MLIQGEVSAATLAKVRTSARAREGVRLALRLAAPAPSSETARHSAGLRPWLEQTWPDAEDREQFVSQTYDLRERLRTAAAVLADLGRRYPPDAVLPPRQQVALNTLAARQLADLTTAYAALEQHLAALVGTVSRPTLPERLPPDWQQRAVAADTATGDLSEALAAILTDPVGHAEDVVASSRRALRPALTALATAIAGQSDTQ